MTRATIPEHGIYGYNVILFPTSLWSLRPVFHKPFGHEHRGDLEETVATDCGKVYSRWVRGAKDQRFHQAEPTMTIMLDPRHATKFARPCEVCYRNGIQEQLPEPEDR